MSRDEPNDGTEKLLDETRESMDKVRTLLDEMKIVQEHEGRVLEDGPK